MFPPKQAALVSRFLTSLREYRLPCGALAAALVACCPMAALSQYTWDNMKIGGGGYVSGMVVQPSSPYLMYARTDVGGAYRWDPANSKWVPITDSFSNSNQYNGNSIAIDPHNPDRVYYAAGQWSGNPYDVYVSDDRGTTWTATKLNKWMQGNGNIRETGERLLVDPNNSNIVYYGSARDGLWKRTGSTWAAVASFPTLGEADFGLNFVVIDPAAGTATLNGETVSKYIYVAVYDSVGSTGGIYKSTDGGVTWTRMSGAAMSKPSRGAVGSDGTFYVSASGDVAKAARSSLALSSIAPGGAINYVPLAVDPSNAQVVMVAERKSASAGGDGLMWRSTNGGSTWTQCMITKHTTNSWFSMTSCILISPTDSNEVWVSDGGGVVRTQDIGNNPSDWYGVHDGIEELYGLTLASPPSGSAILFSGVADAMGWRHTGVDTQATVFTNPQYGWCSGIDYSETNGNVLARVQGLFVSGKHAAYSIDNGVSWSQAATEPSGASGGRIAVSATNTSNFVWLPQGKGPYYTIDRGATWTASTGGQSGMISDEFQGDRQPLAADRVDGLKFYLCGNVTTSPTAGHAAIYRSTDGGKTWTNTANIDYPAGSSSQSTFRIKAAPGRNGEVWVSVPGTGLFRSTDSAATFSPVSSTQGSALFGFGKAAPGKTNPTVFLKGKALIGGAYVNGVFRSDDMASTWQEMDIPSEPFGVGIAALEGDRQVYGRVFLASNGRGIYWGGFSPIVAEAESLAVAGSSGDTTRVFTDANMSGGAGSIIDANATGDFVTYTVPSVSQRTYDVRVGVKNYHSRGIFQLAIAASGSSNFSNVGLPQDEYTPAPAYSEIDLGNWTPGTAGDKSFRFTVTGKNAASIGYSIAVDYIRLIPN